MKIKWCENSLQKLAHSETAVKTAEISLAWVRLECLLRPGAYDNVEDSALQPYFLQVPDYCDARAKSIKEP